MKDYRKTIAQALSDAQVTESGLTAAEAEARLSQYGKNKLEEGKKVSLLSRFLDQLRDP